MRTEWRYLDEAERSAFTVLIAFLNGRLASVEIINWALQLGPGESVKRAAVLALVDGPEGRKLAEPWRTAWRMIEEFWDAPNFGHPATTSLYDIRERIKSGDRSGSLLAAIAACVAPNLRVSALSQRQIKERNAPRRPSTVAQLVSVRLASGPVFDPHTMGLHEIEDDAFLGALADALGSALTRGLDTARRLGWDGERTLYQFGRLYRAYFVPGSDRNSGEREPDKFHEGIAPCVKLLHFVVDRLAKRRTAAALGIVARWKLISSPFHLRLWAALARDPWIACAREVSNFFESLDDHRFWDVQNFPEIAELRAVRFQEFDAATQKALVIRLRKLPPRSEWPRGTDPARLARARLYRGARELRRIEIAGGVLPANGKAWLISKIANFPELAQMNRLDDGFMSTPEAKTVSPNPDARYDNLAGEERLSALEAALGSNRRGWDGDVSAGAWDWMRQAGNATKLIADLEDSEDGGAAFPKLWEQFGWAHSSAPEKNSARPQEQLTAEVSRVLSLLEKVPEATIRQAIEGIAQWISTWQSFAGKLPGGLAVWQRLWPLAVEATDAAQLAEANLDLNLVVRPSGDREPMDLDTLNTPAGKLVGMFLQACPKIDGKENPFAHDSVARTMRDTIVAARGRTGLIVRHRLIEAEALHYFLLADPDWTEQRLIGALLKDDTDALSLWRGLARRTQFVDVLKVIGVAMVARARDSRLGRETRSSLVSSLVVECLHALNQNRAPVVAYVAVQQMIRALDDEVRAHAAGVIQQFVREMSAPKEAREAGPAPEDLFHRAAAPFLRDIWPQERSLSTPGVSKALADLPVTSRGAFVPAVGAIQRFLVPFDTWSLLDYGLLDHEDGEPKLSAIDDAEKAAALLRLLGCTIGTAPSAVIPHDLGNALTQIEKVAPRLVQDPTYRRLATAARR
jgi:hypothetical protein